MSSLEKMKKELTPNQKEILIRANEPNSSILFNIKGMIQVLHQDGPFDFIEMGYDDIEFLKKKGLVALKGDQKGGYFLQGEEYALTPAGRELAKSVS